MKEKILFTVSAVALTLASTARFEEGGAGHYAPGSFASFADVLPDKRNSAVGRALQLVPQQGHDQGLIYEKHAST